MAAITSNTGTFNWSNTAAWVGGVVPCKPFAITGAADSPSTPGLVRITLGSATPWATGDKVNILGVVGTMVVNGSWTVTVIDSTHADLQGSSSTGTYTSGGTAFRGDTITMAAAAVFTIDSAAVDANGLLILGADVNTGGTNALTFTNSTTTILTVGGAYEIRLRGGVSQPSSTWTFPAGSKLVYDPPSGQQYAHTFDRFGKLIFNGTSGSHCTMKTDKSRGGLSCYQAAGGVPQGPFLGTASYTDFIDMGDATHVGVYTNVTDSTIGNVSITHCTYLRSNQYINVGSASWDGNFTFEDCVFTSSVTYTLLGTPGTCIGIASMTAPASVGVRKVNRCSFDKFATIGNVHNLFITNNALMGNFTPGTGTNTWANSSYFTNNFLYKSDANIAGFGGDTLDNYILASVGNPHYMSSATGLTHTGWIIEQHYSILNDAGDIWYSAVGTIHWYKCMVLPNGYDNTMSSSGDFISGAGAGAAFTVEHCTVFGKDNGFLYFGESTGLAAGVVASCKANLLFWPSTNTQTFLIAGAGAQATDFVTVSDYNGLRNPTTANNTCAGVTQAIPGYSGCKVTAAGGAGTNSQLGQHDFQADPQFADTDYRGFLKWYVRAKGGANDFPTALNYIAANPAEIPNLLSWVRAGYRPTNPAYNGATYPGDTMTTDANGNALGGTVGAMAFQAPAATASGAPLLMGF